MYVLYVYVYVYYSQRWAQGVCQLRGLVKQALTLAKPPSSNNPSNPSNPSTADDNSSYSSSAAEGSETKQKEVSEYFLMNQARDVITTLRSEPHQYGGKFQFGKQSSNENIFLFFNHFPEFDAVYLSICTYIYIYHI